MPVSTHSRLKAAGHLQRQIKAVKKVSTHSRLKAAGPACMAAVPMLHCFNTQPPKGGWLLHKDIFIVVICFNTQPPKGGWALKNGARRTGTGFNTQPPKGGWIERGLLKVSSDIVSTHSRLKAAGRPRQNKLLRYSCFNTQPPKGGWPSTHHAARRKRCFNTQPPKGGWCAAKHGRVL